MSEKRKIYLFYLLPLIIWMAFIFYLSSGISLKDVIFHHTYYEKAKIALKQGKIVEHKNTWFDNTLNNMAHTFVYFILGILALRYFSKGSRKFMRKYIIWALIFSVAYGASDEIHQLFVPLRSFSYEDLTMDTIGAILGVLGYAFIKKPFTSLKNFYSMLQ